MYITEIFLQGFRNLSQLHIEPSEGINVIYGSNAQGKTNFLESLYFCAMGRSMRGKSDQQLIAFDAQESHIRLLVQTQNRRDKIDVHLKQNEKKGIAVNGLPVKRLGELFGTLYAVIFSPVLYFFYTVKSLLVREKKISLFCNNFTLVEFYT